MLNVAWDLGLCCFLLLPFPSVSLLSPFCLPSLLLFYPTDIRYPEEEYVGDISDNNEHLQIQYAKVSKKGKDDVEREGGGERKKK